MNVLPLMDLVLSRTGVADAGVATSSEVGRLASWAARGVELLVRDLDVLRAIEDDLAPANDGGFDRVAAELLHGAYEDWSQRAGALLERIGRIERRGHGVAGASDLRDRHCRVLTILQVTIDDADEADEQFRRGQGYTIGEVRNELRASLLAHTSTARTRHND